MNALTQKAIEIGGSSSGIALVRVEAKKHLPGFPSSGCATFLSCLLRQAGFDIPVITWAETLADHLRQQNGWQVISKRNAQAGDVGVSIDGNGNQAADHIWLVVSVTGDHMIVADNQSLQPHARTISGADGKTPTDYFLRPPDDAPAEPVVTTIMLNGRRLQPSSVITSAGQNYIAVLELRQVGADVVWDERSRLVTISVPGK